MARTMVGEEKPAHGRCHHARPGLLDTAYGHAGVSRLNHHRHTFGIETGLNEVSDLLGQALLNLGAAGKQIDNPCQL